MATPQETVEIIDKPQEGTMAQAIHKEAVTGHSSKRRSSLEITPSIQLSIVCGILGFLLGRAPGAVIGMLAGPVLASVGSSIFRGTEVGKS
jgi:hypothetical protein